ncbi:MAG: MotA/TolQ/ExbB proton channel family protein [Planctomycetes bacterium]|nr:MotA/TolQ/ExbB proton channel family protein [Planctomycetota bacterium]
MSGTLVDLTSAASGPLLVAVLVVLALMLAATTVMAGGFLREACGRRAQCAALEHAVRLASVRTPDVRAVLAALAAAPPGLVARAARLADGFGPAAADRVLSTLESRARRALGRHTLLTRLAPMAGLVATLLPLGPALARLADGDVAALADDLGVAFTATVAGLAASCVAFAMGHVRRGWYHDDLEALELVLLRLHGASEDIDDPDAPRGSAHAAGAPEAFAFAFAPGGAGR